MTALPDLRRRAGAILPGLAVAVLVAIAARFLSDHYGAPAMLMALLLGIALNFLSETPRCGAGVDFASTTVLRLGVALLGFRVSFGLIADLGVPVLFLLLALVALTILAGTLLARLFGHGWRFGVLSGGAVAICGASAAVAISAVLPRDARSDERLVFTVATITVLSTFAMVLYPMIAGALALTDTQAGVFVGAAIHDVAQVLGAGFSISEPVGDTATVVKLFRVALLGPVVVVIALLVARQGATARTRPGWTQVLPPFVLAFIAACALASLGVLPAWLLEATSAASAWALLIAIAAVGLRTSLARIATVGPRAIALMAVETLVIAAGALTGALLLV